MKPTGLPADPNPTSINRDGNDPRVMVLPPGVPEDTRYRLTVEAYRPYVRDGDGNAVKGSGLYYKVAGSAVLFEARALKEVAALLERVREALVEMGFKSGN